MKEKKETICMISYCHNLFDDRIYKKEALSLAKNGYQVIHLGFGTESFDYFTLDNIRVIQIKKVRKGPSFKSKVDAWKQSRLTDLYHIAKDLSADVYHLHDVELCRIALKLKDLPWNPHVIYDAHEPYYDNLKDYWTKRSLYKVVLSDIPSILFERKILSGLDHLIATEENVASTFRKKNENTSVVYNYSFFEPLEKVDFDKKEYDLIYSGSLLESKGIFLMIDAIIETKKKGYELRCVFVGELHDSSLQNEIDKIIKEENLEKNILFTGHLPIEKISEYYLKSKIAFCLFPKNRTNRLILPIKLFEYAAFGLPIIGSDFGHIKEIIESDKIGICVNPHNREEVSSAIIDLIENDKYKESFNNCIQCVKEKYLWKYEEPKLLNIYNQVINNGK